MEQLLETLFTPALLIGALTFLSKRLIESYFKTREKESEMMIKNQFDKDVIEFKNSIEKESLRYNVKVAGIFERQANVVSELYSKLYNLESSMNVAINQGTPWDEKYEEFKTCYFKLRKYWGRNRILIPQNVDGEIENLLKDAFWSVENYGSGERQFLGRDFELGTEKKNEALKLKESIPVIMEQLRSSFRCMIGVDD
ncbi:hypothetical protein [Salinivibrio kushneri]|uniref:hypothetical protein n=1 Tax=Salinivibrio kushneri TaxID=1908198 RepID=UPI000989362B|nr:hypothetical protein [Salinivibrio kushneri]OOE63076.1 hypothetical protein BZG19_16235 [Salinivibrio kushneri]